MFKRTMIFMMSCCFAAPMMTSCGDDSGRSDTPVCPNSCDVGQHCDAATGTCVVDEPPQVKECTEACGDGFHCDTTKGECVEDVPEIKECVEACGDGFHCDTTKGECVEDVPEIKECAEECGEGFHCDTTIGECVEDLVCLDICEDGYHCDVSTGECVEDLVCVDACENGYHCDVSTGECVKDIIKDCEIGAFSCIGNILLSCNSLYHWELFEDCEASSKACFLNAEGTYGCFESECNPGATKCVDDAVYICNDYHSYELKDDCTALPDVNACKVEDGVASCVFKCELNSRQCFANSIMVCNAEGNYVVDTVCTEKQECQENAETHVVSCVDYDCEGLMTQCDGKVLLECDGGWFKEKANCELSGMFCRTISETEAICKIADCEPGETKCDGDNLMECTDGEYTLKESCALTDKECVVDPYAMCKEILTVDPGQDSDGDTIVDILECHPEDTSLGFDGNCVDTDKDAIPDYLDIDSDGDTIPDSIEANNEGGLYEPGDADNDGIPNYLDTDSDDNSIPDKDECKGTVDSGTGLFKNCIDTDGNGIYDFLDIDNDGDGFMDVVEINGIVMDPAHESAGHFSGTCGGMNTLGTPTKPVDCDGDTVPDYMDIDSDGDGLTDAFEGLLRLTTGYLARYSADTDGDGIPDAEECALADGKCRDSDGDGIPDYLEVDSDNDGLSDHFETCCNHPTSTDCKNNTTWCSDSTKADGDGDGVTDMVEYGAGTDPNDKNDNPQAKGNFVFVVPYQQPSSPKKQSISVDTSIQKVDLYFAVYSGSTMKSELEIFQNKFPSIIESLQCQDLGKNCLENSECASLNDGNAVCSGSGRCIVNPKIGNDGNGCYVDIWTGFGVWGNINSFKNRVSLTNDISQMKSALNYTYQHLDTEGNDANLIQVPACVVGGSSYCTNTSTINCYSGTDRVGCVGYRRDAARILVQATDKLNYQSGAASQYSAARSADYANFLKTNRIQYIGLWGATTARDQGMKQLACDAGACVSGKCTTTSCQNITTTERDQLFMYGQIQASTIEESLVSLVHKATASMQIEIESSVEDIDTNANKLVKQLVVDTTGGSVVQGKTCSSISNTITTGNYPAIRGLNPGAVVCYDVIPVENQSIFPATNVPQVVRARVKVMGDGSVLNSGIAYFLIPPVIEEGGIF